MLVPWPRGWLHLACTDDEEQGMCEEVTLAAQHGQRIELWSRRKIAQEFGLAKLIWSGSTPRRVAHLFMQWGS